MSRSEKKDPLEWEEIETEHIVSDEWIDIRKSSYRFPDGSVFEPFYSYSRRDYVVIVARDTDGDYICVRQFRQGIKKVTTEFPAGGVEKGENEDYLQTAKRELREETGYESDNWRFMISLPSNATIADNYAHLFVADKCRKVTGQDLDDTEFLNVVKVSKDEIDEMIKNGLFPQAMHVLALKLSEDGRYAPPPGS